MFLKRTFSRKFGDPASFLFKGQVWDSHLADSSPGDRNCDVCHRHIRFLFILKKTQTADPALPPEIGKLEIGRCCFHYFRKWNVDLFKELSVACQYELNREAAIRRDKKAFGKWARAARI